MCRFCLLASTELILIPNGSLLHLHYNTMNSLKSLDMKKVIVININVRNPPQIRSTCNRLNRQCGHVTLLVTIRKYLSSSKISSYMVHIVYARSPL